MNTLEEFMAWWHSTFRKQMQPDATNSEYIDYRKANAIMQNAAWLAFLKAREQK